MRTIEQLFKDIFTIEGKEVDTRDYWAIEEIVEQEFRKVLEIDDLFLSAYASNSFEDPRVSGHFRFCVYGGIKYKELKEQVENMKSPILEVLNTHHPEPTVGISFNGVYEDEDTTYIEGTYVLRKGE